MRKNNKVFETGTAIKIATILSWGPVDSVNITVKDPGDVVILSQAQMVKESDRVYSYIYQTVEVSIYELKILCLASE
jgi:hypothetical protein